jgi:hypothetical protein
MPEDTWKFSFACSAKLSGRSISGALIYSLPFKGKAGAGMVLSECCVAHRGRWRLHPTPILTFPLGEGMTVQAL